MKKRKRKAHRGGPARIYTDADYRLWANDYDQSGDTIGDVARRHDVCYVYVRSAVQSYSVRRRRRLYYA